MATHGELTVGKLIKFLEAFPPNTKVVLGQLGTSDVITECHANTYYPEDNIEQWPLVVLDCGEG